MYPSLSQEGNIESKAALRFEKGNIFMNIIRENGLFFWLNIKSEISLIVKYKSCYYLYGVNSHKSASAVDPAFLKKIRAHSSLGMARESKSVASWAASRLASRGVILGELLDHLLG